jgi:hypothetical protein
MPRGLGRHRPNLLTDIGATRLFAFGCVGVVANRPCTLSIRVRAHRFVEASVQLFALWPE